MMTDDYNLWIQTPVTSCTRYADYGRMEKGLKGFLTACTRYLEKRHEKQEKCKKWQVEREKGQSSL
jgi:hypothetical protein